MLKTNSIEVRTGAILLMIALLTGCSGRVRQPAGYVNPFIGASTNMGKAFVIEARDNSAENRYIQSATLNGKSWNKCAIDYSDIARGGTLVLQMGPQPNHEWGMSLLQAKNER